MSSSKDILFLRIKEVKLLPETLIVGFTLIIAITFDCIKGIIPNWLTISSILLAIGYRVLAQYYEEGILCVQPVLSGAIIGGCTMILPFLLGGIGGGDVKLMMAIGAWLGPLEVVNVAIYSFICGALIALFFIIFRKAGLHLKNVWYDFLTLFLTHTRPPINQSRVYFPFSVAIGAGFLIYLFKGGVL